MNRRHLIAAALATPAIASAQGFDRPLRIIVPNAPGGTSDILARLIAEPLGRALGQNVIVENRAGAGGNIGADAVAKSPPDGHTLLLLDTSVLATNPFLFARLPFDVERDLAPVQMLIYAPYILAVSNRLPARDAAGLVAYAKANPGRLNAANSGTGTLSHLTALALAAAWGTEMVSVPYRGGAPALQDALAGNVPLFVTNAPVGGPHVRSGALKGLGVTTREPWRDLPGVPSFHGLGFAGFEAPTW